MEPGRCLTDGSSTESILFGPFLLYNEGQDDPDPDSLAFNQLMVAIYGFRYLRRVDFNQRSPFSWAFYAKVNYLKLANITKIPPFLNLIKH